MVEPTILPVIRVERYEENETDTKIRKAVERERERCAKLVAGEVYKERYRRWPEISADGNRSNDSDIVKHCDALAAIIRGR